MNSLCTNITVKYQISIPQRDPYRLLGCLYQLFELDLSRIGCNTNELADQVRLIAMFCVQTASGVKMDYMPLSLYHIAAYTGHSDFLPLFLKICDYSEDAALDIFTPAQFAAVKGSLRVLTFFYQNVDNSLYSRMIGCSPYEVLKYNCNTRSWNNRKSKCLTRVYVCGDNETSSLGIAPGMRTSYPVPISFFDSKRIFGEVSQVSFGKYHTLYLIGGQVFSCGLGRYGKLGHGDEKDQLRVRAIGLLEPVVCVAAGLSYSVICTRKKVIVFGLNDKGQLGMGAKGIILTPAVAKAFKDDNSDSIISCSTNNSMTVILMNSYDFYVAGTSNSPFWQKHMSSTFKLVKNNYAYHISSISVINNTVVRISTPEYSSKITLTTDFKSYYSTSFVPIKHCVGVFYAPKFSALFFGDFFPEQDIYENVSNLYLFHENCPSVIYPMKFVDKLTNEKICQIENADISLNGHLVLVDSLGDIYVGDVAQCLEAFFVENCKSLSDKWGNDLFVTVEVNRLRGVLPAKSAFLSPDGRNIVLNLLEINPREILQCTEQFPKLEFPNSDMAVIICLDSNNEECGRYEAPVEVLKHESDVCLSFFERWTDGKPNEFRVTTEPKILETFLSFCSKRCLSLEDSKQELMEMLKFANELLCKDFFTAVKNELFKPPFEISDLRDLYALARQLVSVELYTTLSEVCAAIFPLLLECGFINGLSLDEIAGIERAFSSYTPVNPKMASFLSQIDGSVGDMRPVSEEFLLDIAADIFKVVKEPMDADEFVAFCKCIKNGTQFKNAKERHRRLVSSCLRNPNSGKCDLVKAPDVSEKEVDDLCSPTSNACSNAASECMESKSGYRPPANEKIADPKEERSCEKMEVPKQNIHIRVSPPDGMEACSHSFTEVAQSPVRPPPSAGVSKRTWNVPKADPFVSLSGIQAEEEDKANKENETEKRRNKVSWNNSPSSSLDSQRRTSHSWHQNRSVGGESSFLQIMEDEEARQLETLRQMHSRLADINLEEQAMNELTAHYESEAEVQGSAVTVSAELKKEEMSDPLWAARS